MATNTWYDVRAVIENGQVLLGLRGMTATLPWVCEQAGYGIDFCGVRSFFVS